MTHFVADDEDEVDEETRAWEKQHVVFESDEKREQMNEQLRRNNEFFENAKLVITAVIYLIPWMAVVYALLTFAQRLSNMLTLLEEALTKYVGG